MYPSTSFNYDQQIAYLSVCILSSTFFSSLPSDYFEANNILGFHKLYECLICENKITQNIICRNPVLQSYCKKQSVLNFKLFGQMQDTISAFRSVALYINILMIIAVRTHLNQCLSILTLSLEFFIFRRPYLHHMVEMLKDNIYDTH